MPIAAASHPRRTTLRLIATFALPCLLGLAACEEDQAPRPAPSGIQLVAGDAQYTLKGTELEEPVVARVTLEDGTAAAGVAVRFQVIEGGGSLSRTTATTSGSGRASVRWTVGPNTGANRLRLSAADNTSVTVVASATSAEYYCPEEDPAFAQKFFDAHDLVLLTRASALTQEAGSAVAGLVRIEPNFGALTFVGTSLRNYDEGTFDNVVRDCAFSANGDLYVSWTNIHDEVVKIAADGTASHFCALEPSPLGSEIAMAPGGVLVGCDEVGPFAVTCRDSVYRYEDAIFSGVGRDATNHDAVAVDPTSGDLYFIYKADRTLRRIPLDGIAQTGPTVEVVTLPIDESDWARGMVVDGTDNSVYILVESALTRSIVKVTAAGIRSTEYDFFARGAGDAAGIQNDLAIDRDYRFLYTLDTKNNVVLLYRLATHDLFELSSSADPEAASNGNTGERVGLDVIPGP